MVLYILLMAVLNIGLGFAVALYLGRRTALATLMADPAAPGAALAGAPAEAGSHSRDSALRPDPLPHPPQETPVNSARAATTSAPAPGPNPSGMAETSASAVPIAQDRPGSPAEAAVTSLQVEVDQYHEKLTEADDALRAYVGTADAVAIEACLASLMEATNEYLQKREQAHHGVAAACEGQAEFHKARENIQEAIDRQDLQVQSSSRAIQTIDCQKDPAVGCRQALDQTSKLLDTNHHLRDTVDGALAEIARKERRLNLAPLARRNDPVTGLSGRAGLEASLLEWWENDPQRGRPLSAAMLDVDRFGEVNERFGHKAGDRLLGAVGQFLQTEQRGEGTVARLAGQRFFMLFPDADARQTVNAVERIRQGIELARFRCQHADIQITISCSVTETTAEDTSETLFARAEATLREAKRYGRNRTFLHEGKYPTPVVPPNFALGARQIDL